MAFKDEKWLKWRVRARLNGSTYKVEIQYADRYGCGHQLLFQTLCSQSTPLWHCTDDLSWLVTRRHARASVNVSKKSTSPKKILVTNFFSKYVLNTIKRKKKWKKLSFFFGRRRPFFRPSIAQSPFFLWKWNAISILYNFCFHRFTLRSL